MNNFFRPLGARTEPLLCDEAMQGNALTEGQLPYLPQIDLLDITTAKYPLYISCRADASSSVVHGVF